MKAETTTLQLFIRLLSSTLLSLSPPAKLFLRIFRQFYWLNEREIEPKRVKRCQQMNGHWQVDSRRRGMYINRIFQGRIPYRGKVLRLTSGGNVEELSDPENIWRFRVTSSPVNLPKNHGLRKDHVI